MEKTFTVSVYGKPIAQGIASIQEAVIIAGTHDNYRCRFEGKGKAKALTYAQDPSPSSVNERAEGLATVDEGDKALTKALLESFAGQSLHSRYFDMTITEVEPQPEGPTDAQRIAGLESELDKAAAENQRLNTELSAAVDMITQLRQDLEAANAKLSPSPQ